MQFSLEELVGMLFDYCREISEEYAGVIVGKFREHKHCNTVVMFSVCLF